MADKYRPRVSTMDTSDDSDETPVVTLEHVKCPVCGEPMRYEGRHVSGPWDDPPRPTSVEMFLSCTCLAPEGFEL
jgi:hypothetical protein